MANTTRKTKPGKTNPPRRRYRFRPRSAGSVPTPETKPKAPAKPNTDPKPPE